MTEEDSLRYTNLHAMKIFCEAVKTFVNEETNKQTTVADALGAMAFGMGNAYAMAVTVFAQQAGAKVDKEFVAAMAKAFQKIACGEVRRALTGDQAMAALDEQVAQ